MKILYEVTYWDEDCDDDITKGYFHTLEDAKRARTILANNGLEANVFQSAIPLFESAEEYNTFTTNVRKKAESLLPAYQAYLKKKRAIHTMFQLDTFMYLSFPEISDVETDALVKEINQLMDQ